MREVIERFNAADEDGNVYAIVIWQEIIPAPAMGNLDQTVTGLPSIELSDGTPLNSIDKDTFSFADTGELLKRVSI